MIDHLYNIVKGQLLTPGPFRFSVYVAVMDLATITAIVYLSPVYVSSITKKEDAWYFNDNTAYLYNWLFILGGL